jgi:tetratricopeptide (TPR) repeat protein
MIRGTRQKQTGRVTGRRKASPAPRKSGSSRASRHKPAPRAPLPVKAKSRRKASSQPLGKPADPEREAALKNFETAIGHFQKKDYPKAAALFAKLAAGPVREIADRARVHLRFCESKQRQEVPPKTAEGFYARGVAALNSRDFDQALQYLNKSDKMIPDQEYVHYALAAAYGLNGDSDRAFVHLTTAIKLRPQNRGQARRDEDFQILAGDPRFTQLLGSGA